MQNFEMVQNSFRWFQIIGSGVLIVIVLILIFAFRNPEFSIGASDLVISNSFFGRSIPLSQLDRASARIVDLASDTELQPVLRTNGVGLPGYKAGWFRLRNDGKALVFMGSGSSAVRIGTTEGYDVLLAPDDPQAFLAALKAAK